jgi:hypothetical protein
LAEPASAAAAHPGLTHLTLIATLATWIVSMVAVGIFFAGRKWMWFGAGAAAAILGVPIATLVSRRRRLAGIRCALAA